MNKTKTTLFIPDTSGASDFLTLPETRKRYPRLLAAALARSLRSQQDWEILAKNLITICQYAHNGRDTDVLKEVSQLLVSLPLPRRFRAIGRYYEGKFFLHTARFDEARTIFEDLATVPDFPWKSRAIATVGTCHWYTGDLEAAMAFSIEAERANRNHSDLQVSLNSQWLIAVIQSVQGYHRQALELLDGLYPLISYAAKTHPVTFYDYANSVAVEQIALNRFNEAERLCNATLSSPFAPNFPNWSETKNELLEKKEALAFTVFVNIEDHVNLRADHSVSNETILKNTATEIPTTKIEAKRLLLKAQARSAFGVLLNLRITSIPERHRSAVRAATYSQARSQLVITEQVPDNRRPRAPPTFFQTPKSHLLIP